jgi:hypothetical protein
MPRDAPVTSALRPWNRLLSLWDVIGFRDRRIVEFNTGGRVPLDSDSVGSGVRT